MDKIRRGQFAPVFLSVWLSLSPAQADTIKSDPAQVDPALPIIALVPGWQGEALCLTADATQARLTDAQGAIRWAYAAQPGEVLFAGGAACVTEGSARLRLTRAPMPFGDPRQTVSITLLPR